MPDARVLSRPVGKMGLIVLYAHMDECFLQELDMELMGKRRKINPGVSSSAHISPCNGRTSSETLGDGHSLSVFRTGTDPCITVEPYTEHLPIQRGSGSSLSPPLGGADLDRAAEGKATHGISMKDDHAVPSSHPGGRHLCTLAYPPAKVQDGPSSDVSLLHMPWKKSASPVSERLDGPAALPAFECQRASRSCHGPLPHGGNFPLSPHRYPQGTCTAQTIT
ncbi:50S ribosomal protein L9, partial [Dissostichus eleginoides]